MNETSIDNEQKDKIRILNDLLRKELIGGNVLATKGVNALPDIIKAKVFELIRDFDEFTENNDPHGLHDFGEVEHQGLRVWFKIDCYDNDLKYGSPNASDPEVTKRVMTILLPEEY